MERTHVAIRQLVDRIDRGELKLPEMQRGYVWKPTQVASLVDSLYRGYPSGSMLLWRPTEEVAERLASITASGTGPMAIPQYLLDGQQRLTSLHRVMTRHERADVVFNVEDGPGMDTLVGSPPAGWLLRLPSHEDEPELEEPHWMDLDDYGSRRRHRAGVVFP